MLDQLSGLYNGEYAVLKKDDRKSVADDVISTLLEATPRQQSGIALKGRSVQENVARRSAVGRASQKTCSSVHSACIITRGSTISTEAGMDVEGSGQSAGP